ncbi:MAG TPA: hypothetical protein VGM75_37045 [Pseudonocardiaceae bacterium]|jgi:hypothetical protein
MSVPMGLRKRIVLAGVIVLSVSAATPMTAAAAVPLAASLAGAWNVTVVEYSQGGPFTRTGVFTYSSDGTGTVATSGGFTGALDWQQSGSSITFTFEHNLPAGGLAYGTENGTISATTFTSTGTITTFDSNGDQTDSFEGDFSSTLQ